MPSDRVAAATLTLNRFDVVGQDGAESTFIAHAGLAESAGSQNAARIPVLDMGPPLHGHSAPGHIKADVVGSAALTDDEANKIKTFVDRHANEHAAFAQVNARQLVQRAPEMYCVLPHASPLLEDDGRYARTRFSCAGFVVEAYNKARIRLLDLNGLPPVGMSIIAVAYPQQTRLITNGRVSADAFGLGGRGPWKVLLCGYLFHALNRDANMIRRESYTPTLDNRHFG